MPLHAQWNHFVHFQPETGLIVRQCAGLQQQYGHRRERHNYITEYQQRALKGDVCVAAGSLVTGEADSGHATLTKGKYLVCCWCYSVVVLFLPLFCESWS